MNVGKTVNTIDPEKDFHLTNPRCQGLLRH